MGYKITSPLPVVEGGTGATTLTDHGVLLGSGTAAITALGAMTNGQLVIGSTGADPVVASLTAGTGITATTGAGTLSLATNTSAGNWVLIQSQTASSSASLSFTTGITGYQMYAWVLDRVIPVTNGVNLRLLLSTNGGSSYETTNYQGGMNYWSYNSATWNNSNITTSICYLTGAVNTATLGISATIFTSTSSGVNPYLWGSVYYNGTNTLVQGTHTTTSVVNAFQWLMSSGNIASGTFSLYGIKQ